MSFQYHCFSAITIPEFTAVFDSKKNAVLIKWQHKQADVKTYAIQRSLDNNTWFDIALQEVNPNSAPNSFYFEDKKPSVGENYYRLKSISSNGKIEYSLGVMVITGSLSNNWIMYPVPVKDLLTLEYRGSESVKGVINVFIQQSSGRIITRLRNSSLNKIIKIPVDNLGKGIYDIRIIVQGEIVWNQRFIK
ncbi:MAG: hypothetical protein ABI685_09320 [Ferruginibacter sp.]